LSPLPNRPAAWILSTPYFLCDGCLPREGSTRRLGPAAAVALRRQHARGFHHAGEGRAPAGFAFDDQAALVEVEHVLDDRESEAGSAGLARAAGGHAIEPLGEAKQVLRKDAQPAVTHREDGCAVDCL